MNAQSQSAPAPGRPVGSLGARGRRRQMVADCIAALGGEARMTAMRLQDIDRAVDLVLLTRSARADLAAGKTTVTNVVKLENAADRAVRRLNLPAPGQSKSATKYGLPESVPTLQDYF